MKINLKFLLIGTSLSLIPNLTYAQCAETDCLKLGYVSLKSCTNGLKCPFGEYWACPDSATTTCDASYQYTCTGANQVKPAGGGCGEKYISCFCTTGYEWTNGTCKYIQATLGTCTGYAQKCTIGQILNSDGTCSADKVSGKTPIGIVVAKYGNCGYAMTASSISRGIVWSTEYINTGTFQSKDWQLAINDYNVNGNMTKIIQASNGDSSKYPAAYAALNYASTGTTAGQWSLPTAGILNSVYTNLNIINNTISKLGGITLGSSEYIWSSSEYAIGGVWLFDTTNGVNYGGLHANIKNTYGQVRPVIAF